MLHASGIEPKKPAEPTETTDAAHEAGGMTPRDALVELVERVGARYGAAVTAQRAPVHSDPVTLVPSWNTIQTSLDPDSPGSTF